MEIAFVQTLHDLIYRPGLSLSATGLLVGLWLIASHVIVLIKPATVSEFLKALPRNEKLGAFIMGAAFLWAFILITGKDLGEFYKYRHLAQLLVIGVGAGMIVLVKEFTAVRGLGFLMILAATPMLNSAFLEPPLSRLLLVAFAYAIVVIGMFLIGKPYLMRDAISWLTSRESRLRIGAVAGVVYGLIVAICAVTAW